MYCNKCHYGSEWAKFPLVTPAGTKMEENKPVTTKATYMCPQCRAVADNHLTRSPFPPPGSASLHARDKLKRKPRRERDREEE